ncbi:MAG: CoA pyrophosphatase [bacterium]|nr:CoA pyrophosphatase [bacterium]MBU1917905.1 CoA pyrophosphatase [bacterium]
MALNHRFKKAAVLIPAYMQDGEISILFTKRSDLVEHHKGQICFPGGSVDEQDLSLWYTALRETNEEIGITAEKIFYICELSKLRTPSFFEITPFLGFIHTDFTLKLNPSEIDTIFSVPVSHFFDETNVRFQELLLIDKTIHSPCYVFKEHEIWGATARILYGLLEKW